MIFENEIRTGIEDVGKNGLITDKAILKMLENVGGYQSDEIGYGVLDIPTNGVSWVILEWKVKVIDRPRYGEKLLVRTWGRNPRKAYTFRDYEIYNSSHKLCVIATTKWALINMKTRKVEKITDDIVAKYKMEDRCVFEDRTIERIKIPTEFTNSTEYQIRRCNIDINGHLHNTYYMDLAEEALPEKVYQTRPFENIRISYKNEVKLGDIVECKYSYQNNKHIIVIQNKETEILNAVVEL